MPAMPSATYSPQHGNEQTHQRQGERGNNRHETNAAKEGEGVMQNRVLKTVMQKIGDNPQPQCHLIPPSR